MLLDETSIAIMSAARQSRLRDPGRSFQHFANIIEDFFAGVRLDGAHLDLGPGQFDWGRIVREHGGSCTGVDKDEAVLELGRHLGFPVVAHDLQRLSEAPLPGPWRGVFDKFAWNAFWHRRKDERHRREIAALARLVEPGGFAWIAPWNGISKDLAEGDPLIAHTLGVQDQAFAAEGFLRHELTPLEAARYGITGKVANHVVFTKGLGPWRRPAA